LTEEEKKEIKLSGKGDPIPGEPHHYKSWWWGVIPAVAAAVILLAWATGQFEEVFGIDPRGIWHGETLVEGTDEGVPGKSKIRWRMLVEDAAGELWFKLSRNNEEVMSGPVTIDENAIYHKGYLGYIHAIYHTRAIRFRYNPFVKRRLNAVVFLRTGESYVVEFVRE
jgi:hypothetical protein